jgi:hypothetical protein
LKILFYLIYFQLQIADCSRKILSRRRADIGRVLGVHPTKYQLVLYRPLTASKINGLFEIGGTLCKKTDKVLAELLASPARIVLERFMKWALKSKPGGG